MTDRPRYMISVAAEIVGMHPQTLRLYEAKGLLRPGRTPGGTRLYSDADIAKVVALAKKARKTWKGGTPATPVKEGVRRFVEWYRAYYRQ